MSKRSLKGLQGEDRHYESVLVIDPQIGEDTVTSIVDKTRAILEKEKVKDLTFEDWGRKKLAYPVNKKTYGQFFCFEFSHDGTIVKTLESHYKLTEGVLRYITLLVDKRLKQQREETKAQEAESKTGDSDEEGAEKKSGTKKAGAAVS